MNLIKQLSPKHEFAVLAPFHSHQKPLLEAANQVCEVIPTWLPEAPPPRSRLYYQINSWRQTFFDPLPRLVKNFYSPQVQEAVVKQLSKRNYDILQVQQLYMVQYIPVKMEKPGVLDVDNLWSKLVARQAGLARQRFTHRLQTSLDLRKIPGYEKRSLQRFAGLLAISPQDEGIIQQLAPQAQTAVVQNGVDCEFFTPTFCNGWRESAGQNEPNRGGPMILFTGTMAYEPNVDAVAYFAHEIFPLVRQNYPRAIFRIVGRDPLPAVQALAEDPQIQVEGFVEDIRPYLAGCDVFVVPLRAGAGTRLKILEAMAMSKGIVTTSLGAEGLNVQDDENLLVADSPADFAGAVTHLIDNPDQARRLGENGRRLVAEEYDWKAIAARLDRLYENLSR